MSSLPIVIKGTAFSTAVSSFFTVVFGLQDKATTNR
ncbi:hypothetical protein B879_02971 [Cecembia lonarensis LW9]|uniref:Uncharacterized protein n=1 Tax=Cecembia lonarensis (strain CCUG 58316 / KCTC 22772 / LW9) TaxID=1225176 RepID=K1LDF2_CECL9|nr:hypothetical protein B879_02971 [Cecembia lonarensis LW9]